MRRSPERVEVRGLGLPCAGAVVGGGTLLILRDAPDLRVREGFAVVAFGWLCVGLLGAVPFWLSGQIPSFTDAAFESISGFSTTGASILTDIESRSHGTLFWRALSHWLGGMGIVLLAVAILPLLGVGGMQLYRAEVPGPVAERLTPRIRETAKRLWAVYFLLTVLEIAAQIAFRLVRGNAGELVEAVLGQARAQPAAARRRPSEPNATCA